MTVFLTICIIACFIISFLAFIYPIIPGILAVWAGYFIYHFGINGGELTISFGLFKLFSHYSFSLLILLQMDIFKEIRSSKWANVSE